MPMAKEFHAASNKVDPDFIHAGEGPQDWLMQYYPVSYFRINNGSRAVCRYIDSQVPLLVSMTVLTIAKCSTCFWRIDTSLVMNRSISKVI